MSGTPGERRVDPLGAGGVDRVGTGRFAHHERPRGCQREEQAAANRPRAREERGTSSAISARCDGYRSHHPGHPAGGA